MVDDCINLSERIKRRIVAFEMIIFCLGRDAGVSPQESMVKYPIPLTDSLSYICFHSKKMAVARLELATSR